MYTENVLVKTKMCVPETGKHTIVRRRLDARLREGLQHKVTLISAPAGYGKTTAAASYLSRSGKPTAWYSLGPEDNDPVLFWKRLLFSLDTALPGGAFGALSPSFELVSSNLLPGLVVDRLCDLPEQVFIVLDDYHLVVHEVILKSVLYLAGYLPDHAHLLILSRREPDAGFTVLLAKGAALAVGSTELALDLAETGQFYKKRGFIFSPDELDALHSATEGWAAGLVLQTLPSSRSAGVSPGLTAGTGSFLNDEVFFKWEEDVRAFLVETSVLGQLSGPLCAAVTGNRDSAALLRCLSGWNSFITPLDAQNTWFRVHPLFGAFLRDKLKDLGEDAVRGLYSRAGHWYLGNGFEQEALGAFLDAGIYAEAESLFWTVYPGYASSGEFSTLLGWLERLPEVRHRFNALYCFIRGWLLNMEERPEEAAFWNDRAMTAFEARNFQLYGFESEEVLMKTLILCQADLAMRRMDILGVMAIYARAAEYSHLPPVFHGEVNACQPSLLKTANGLFGRIRLLTSARVSDGVYATNVFRNVSTFSLVGHIEMLYECDMLDDCAALARTSLPQILETALDGALVPYFFTCAKLRRAANDMDGAFEVLADCRKRLSAAKAIWGYICDLFEAELALNAGNTRRAEALLPLGRLGIYDALSGSREFEYLTWARYLLKTGKADKAAVLLLRLDNMAENRQRLSSRIEILSLLAVADFQAGRPEEASRCLDEALDLGMEHRYARTYLDQGPVIARLLSAYVAVAETGEKRLYADDLRLRFPPEPSGTTGPVGTEPLLSRQERRVLTLVAEGCSNGDIAARLGISGNTVKYHNMNIFGKLGVKNRGEAAAAARERGLL